MAVALCGTRVHFPFPCIWTKCAPLQSIASSQSQCIHGASDRDGKKTKSVVSMCVWYILHSASTQYPSISTFQSSAVVFSIPMALHTNDVRTNHFGVRACYGCNEIGMCAVVCVRVPHQPNGYIDLMDESIHCAVMWNGDGCIIHSTKQCLRFIMSKSLAMRKHWMT